MRVKIFKHVTLKFLIIFPVHRIGGSKVERSLGQTFIDLCKKDKHLRHSHTQES